jgi:hypothetical protein
MLARAAVRIVPFGSGKSRQMSWEEVMVLERWMMGAVAAASMACATTSTSGGGKLGKPVVTFPSSSELERMVAQGAQPAPPFQTMEVERWTVQGPIPATGAEYAATTPWDELLKKVVAEQGGRLTASSALGCAARETARFYVEHGASPSDGLQRYLVARCGGSLPAVRLATFGGPTPDDIADEDVQSKLGQKFPEFLQAQLPRGRGEVGLGYARGKGRVVIAFYGGDVRARLDNFSPLVSGNQAVLEGELPAQAAFGLALINQGKNAVASCEPDAAVQLPKFRFSCPMLESDAQARVDVAIRRAGQMLPDPVLSVLVRRSDQAGLQYEPALAGDLKANVDEAGFESTVFAKVNEFRSSAGLRALTLDAAQSKTNARVAPHWFAATFKGDDPTVQRLALGLLAGWQVQGTIRDGAVYSGYLASTRSPERWLSDALDSPLGRSTLLDPHAVRIAIGSGALGQTGIYSVVTAYSFFDAQARQAEETLVFDELTHIRAARGLPTPKKMERHRALDSALEQISANVEDAGAAIQSALKEIRKTEQRTVYGWALETNDLKQLKWSENLFKPNLQEMSVGVTHYKVPGAAWGQYAVLVVVFDAAEPKRTPGIEGPSPAADKLN